MLEAQRNPLVAVLFDSSMDDAPAIEAGSGDPTKAMYLHDNRGYSVAAMTDNAGTALGRYRNDPDNRMVKLEGQSGCRRLSKVHISCLRDHIQRHTACVHMELIMQASILDLRRRMPEVLRALDRNERVTIFYRGKERAVLVPSRSAAAKRSKGKAAHHKAFGMWADRKDLMDVVLHIRTLRRGREHAV
jgi:antitoxin (DNA-binding transcriptional repressor) of toxin-antitoxin stability system